MNKMKDTRAINNLWYKVTAKESNIIHTTTSRLEAYKQADYFKDLGYQGIKIVKVTSIVEAETVEENY